VSANNFTFTYRTSLFNICTELQLFKIYIEDNRKSTSDVDVITYTTIR